MNKKGKIIRLNEKEKASNVTNRRKKHPNNSKRIVHTYSS